MLAREAHLVAVDFESTGTVPGYPDEPWQIGIVPIAGGKPDPSGVHERYIQVASDRPFNPCAPGSWRKVRAEIAAALPLAEMVPTFGALVLGVPLVAHNASTEKKFFRKHWPLHRPGPWIDTLKLSRMAYPGLEMYELGEVIRHTGLEPQVRELVPGRDVHDALYDAAACAVLLSHLLRQPAWQDLTVDDLCRARG